ncbi:MAG: hypothetical protein AAGG51_03490 [Cyanobacteria bacterium P01_G01_bin.54]
MALSDAELKQLLDRLVFDQTDPKDWVQDVWDLNPLLGENAARLYEVYRALLDCCPPEQLTLLWERLYAQAQEADTAHLN